MCEMLIMLLSLFSLKIRLQLISLMRILTEENIESLKLRGYIKRDVGDYKLSEFNSLLCLSKYNVNPDRYMSLFSSLTVSGLRNLIRFICLKWHNVAESLNDVPLSDFSRKYPTDICKFFTEKDHRVYFFIEIIHQYFFP